MTSMNLESVAVRRETTFYTRDELAAMVTRTIRAALTRAMVARRRASLVVSGGSTAKLIFPILRAERIAWENVTVTLADERWVPATSEHSNEALVRRELLVGPASAARFVGLYASGRTSIEGCEERERALSFIERPYDVVLLGMGDDGHVASLFSSTKAEVLDGSSSSLVVAGTAPAEPRERVSLTPRALLDAQRVLLVFTGHSKLRTYERARNEGSLSELPVRAILHGPTKGEVDVYWAP